MDKQKDIEYALMEEINKRCGNLQVVQFVIFNYCEERNMLEITLETELQYGDKHSYTEYSFENDTLIGEIILKNLRLLMEAATRIGYEEGKEDYR